MKKDRPDWQISIDKLFTRITNKCKAELIQKLVKLNSLYNSKNSNVEIEPSDIKLLRSIDNRIYSSNNNFLKEFTVLVNLLIDHPVYPLPSEIEYNECILTPIKDLQNSYPYSQISLSLSSPVAFPHKPSINIVKRYFDCDLRLKLKLKLGIFFDDQENLFWETGFIFPEKSIKHLCKNFSDYNTQMLVSSSMLKNIVDNIFELLKQKKIISGIDLTPAHYHILPFSIRLGGKLIDPDLYNEYKYDLLKSIDYTFQDELHCNDNIYQFAKSQYFTKNKLDTLTMSMMLYKNLIFKKDSRENFRWIPPRVIISNTGLKEIVK